jgi:hypothetical protein
MAYRVVVGLLAPMGLREEESGQTMFFVHPDLNSGADTDGVSICVASVDNEGNQIPREWFDLGVIPAADRLRKLAAFHLDDVWRVSELAERVVHQLARTHGKNLGVWPHRQVIRVAQWEVLILKAGSLRDHKRGAERDFRESEDCMNELAVRAGRRNEDELVGRLSLDEIRNKLEKNQLQETFELRRHGWTWEEIRVYYGLTEQGIDAQRKALTRAIATALPYDEHGKCQSTKKTTKKISTTPLMKRSSARIPIPSVSAALAAPLSSTSSLLRLRNASRPQKSMLPIPSTSCTARNATGS